jgi:hypothetical protein
MTRKSDGVGEDEAKVATRGCKPMIDGANGISVSPCLVLGVGQGLTKIPLATI